MSGFKSLETARRHARLFQIVYHLCPDAWHLCSDAWHLCSDAWHLCSDAAPLLRCRTFAPVELIGENSSGNGKPIIAGNESYVALMRENGQMVALDMVTGELKWRRQFSDSIYRIIPTWEYLYFIEKKLGGIYLCALDAHDGSSKWITLLEKTPVSAEVILTRQYIVVSLNRYSRGYHSSILVLDKATGDKLKNYPVHSGIRGHTYTQARVCGEKLWLVKDNMIWVLGK